MLLLFELLCENWPILIIFGMQHHAETWRKWLQFWSPYLMHCYTTLWNLEVVVWPFTTMNSYL